MTRQVRDLGSTPSRAQWAVARVVVALLLTVNNTQYDGERFPGQNKKVLEIAAKESEASQRTETSSEMMGINNSPWNPDEQKLLEQVESLYLA